ncbi:PREDICTED: G-type lectin S-receptor-like serine/threonine-protein kinase B120 isoform X2 [Fragaria vesca subsp. vesca]|uniref:G-type lectin S-receptor-like serine/threonine-protein kinase B120 isoform X2 n=1 Tax=Fragaria vesca subsp. vesca TaxID=101020 RepID=UPI0002C2FC3B|nr:PREDICTED: G-type lectin S-receptor-like serine/threonine-protein kinase B120 isoform X2 [Fragaria vesca subsp. vesca]
MWSKELESSGDQLCTPAVMLVPLIWLISSSSFFTFSSATDTLTPSDSLRDNQVLVSAGGVFELGLFNESISGYYYLGIWLRADPTRIVWVARDNPILDSSGLLQILSGNLVLTDRRQVQLILNSGSLAKATTANTSATLLDTGNFVLKEVDTGNTIWQSFDVASDTYLPGMKLGLFGQELHNIVSWASPQNPARGIFNLGMSNDTSKLSVGLGNNGESIEISFWDGNSIRFIFENSTANMYNFSFHSNANEAFYSFTTSKNYDLVWFVINYTGNLDQYYMVDGKISSVSHALCADSTGGNTRTCINSIPSDCEDGADFSQINGLLPSTPNTSGSHNMVIPDCETFCKNNCSCTAFASVRIGQPGCQFYYGSKQDLLKNIEKGAGFIYIRGGGPSDAKKWKVRLAVAIPLASLLVFVPISFTCYLCWRRQLKGLLLNKELGVHKDQELPLYSFATIKKATNYFSESNKLGEGGYGPVYKGVLLVDGQEIAVKRLSKISRQGLREFKNEISLICKLQHRNLVRLLGCCIEAEESILIYEYLPNKSLDFFIFDSIKHVLLDWRRRVNIIEGIAQGLLYLHKYSRLRIIHRDLKTSNILLDSEMNPKISDFGMATIFGDSDIRGRTNRVVGTFGYMSPEYATYGLFSEKSDVFSFGVILLEIISGEKNIAFFEADHTLNLISKAWHLWKEGSSMELMDSTLRASCSSGEVIRCIHIGLLCVQERAIDRPTMSDVISLLSNQSSALPLPKEPAFLSHSGSTDADSSSSRQRYHSQNEVTISEECGR